MGCFDLTGSLAACGVTKAMGAGADVWLISVGDISAIARDSSGSITGITLVSLAKAAKIEGLGTSFRPKQNLQGNDIIPLFSHECAFVIWDDASDTAVAINNLANDTVLAIYLDSKGNYKCLGTGSVASATDIGPGMITQEYTDDPYDTAAVGGLRFMLKTRETAPVLSKAPFVSITGGTAVWLAANTYANI
jgi:hypothetical protein